jgi:hypothetical protein
MVHQGMREEPFIRRQIADLKMPMTAFCRRVAPMSCMLFADIRVDLLKG